ncbi:hypothetical protein BamIOP4010DRAFT_6916 [Burkholderia ambifaria IOP40-10]|uniref:Uncharacterized protein n=1 Tax=Burkholderia ambifaria IOP40-10 TaxID=396596 RepID=B1FSA3_9BURK|nr:hypothetical protein BamIOP4010DRAFT_6916 [Burkholderia ambifaria IOP40-10]
MITGSVATFSPMPSRAITALHRIDTSVSGTTMHSTARHERNVTAQSSAIAPKIDSSIAISASPTASLVAAITPTLPPASRNATFGVGWSAA